jgi:hypothetical protein
VSTYAKNQQEKDDYTVDYAFKLTIKCCHDQKIIKVTSVKGVASLEDQAMAMKNQVFRTLERHKTRAEENNVDCLLDYELYAGALPQSDLMWQYLWAFAENKINSKIIAAQAVSASRQKGHQTRVTKRLERDWEKRTPIQLRQTRHYARGAVMEALELQSGKSIVQATDILCYMISKLIQESNKVGLEIDKNEFVSTEQNKMFGAMLNRATPCIAGMKR